MKHIQDYMAAKATGKREAKLLERFWTKKANHVGLILSERLINIPMDLVPPLYEALFEEILWATEDEVHTWSLVSCSPVLVVAFLFQILTTEVFGMLIAANRRAPKFVQVQALPGYD